MRTPLTFVLVLILAPLLSGCITDDGEDDGDAPPAVADRWVARWANLTFAGTAVAADPVVSDPTGACAFGAGEEGVHYNLHAFTPPNATTLVRITLSWDAQAVPDVWTVPDLEMYLWDPDGVDVSECAGQTPNQPEVIEILLTDSREYRIVVANYAGAAVDYSIDAAMSYRELVPGNATAPAGA